MEVYVRHITETESWFLTKIRFVDLDALIDRLKQDGVYHAGMGHHFREIFYQIVLDHSSAYLEVLLGEEE